MNPAAPSSSFALSASERSDPVNVLIVGVGGQGVILVSKVLARLGQQRGYQVKQSEVHGMAKRGGSVFSHVRYGREVWSPTIARGEVVPEGFIHPGRDAEGAGLHDAAERLVVHAAGHLRPPVM